MTFTRHFRITASALLLPCAMLLSTAHAQEAPPTTQETATSAPEDIPSIQVTGIRDPLSIPYAMAYELLTEIAKTSDNRVHLNFRVTSSKTHQPIPQLEINLQGEHTQEKVAISPDGFLTIPLSQAAHDDKAELIANVKKGNLVIEGFLTPDLGKGNPRYADMVDIIKLAKRVRGQMLPWYLRLVTPTVGGIGICYADKTQVIAVEGSSTAPRAATLPDTDPLNQKVYCAAYKEREPALSADAVLLAPPGWQALFISSFF